MASAENGRKKMVAKYVYGLCAFAEVFFSCSHTVLPKEHSLGVIFFLLSFLMLCCIFSSIPCLPVLSTPLSYMYVMYGQVDGLFHWYL